MYTGDFACACRVWTANAPTAMPANIDRATMYLILK
jgi:hypothetical protein